jgi:hypothetical protein
MAIPDFREDSWLPEGHYPATWDEVVERFSGQESSKRKSLTTRLFWLRDRLKANGVTGYILLDGGYISAKENPKDFDVFLVAQPGIQTLKDRTPELRDLLDSEKSEEIGYSVLYSPNNSEVLEMLLSVWDCIKYTNTRKGVLKLEL